MGVSKISVSIDDDALAEARQRVGRRGLSAYISRALQRQLQADRLGQLLDEMAAESGPIPAEILEEVEALWHVHD
jgi:Arc/MetJ family transcription regulator